LKLFGIKIASQAGENTFTFSEIDIPIWLLRQCTRVDELDFAVER
jgi:hypothetical protein